jgi:cytochrome P450
MTNYPEMQNKMRGEIESVIGDRMPVQEDRNNCHYVNAFISEAMRFKPIVPMGLAHKNVVQSKIGIILNILLDILKF